MIGVDWLNRRDVVTLMKSIAVESVTRSDHRVYCHVIVGTTDVATVRDVNVDKSVIVPSQFLCCGEM